MGVRSSVGGNCYTIWFLDLGPSPQWKKKIKNLEIPSSQKYNQIYPMPIELLLEIGQSDPHPTCSSKTLTNTDEILPAISIKGMLGI